jgi:hypothetical protein
MNTKGEKMNDDTKSAYSTGEHFNTLKSQGGEYNDFFNELFANKKHPAYARCAR